MPRKFFTSDGDSEADVPQTPRKGAKTSKLDSPGSALRTRGISSLTDTEWVEIHKLHAEGCGFTAIAKQFDIKSVSHLKRAFESQQAKAFEWEAQHTLAIGQKLPKILDFISKETGIPAKAIDSQFKLKALFSV